MVYWRINQTDIDWILAREDMYAIYLNCHGRVDENNSRAQLYDSDYFYDSNGFVDCYSYTNFGNWRFVFLDACLTSSTKLWCNAFHCTDAGECFVGWNNSVKKVTEYDFVQRFFPRLGSMSVHDAVVTSLWESREAGYNDINGMICNLGFYGDMNYYGWAWR